MTTIGNNPFGFHGVDRAVVEAAMRKARRERSEAVWAMLQKIFGRRADHEDKVDQTPADIGSIANAGVH